jgi:hypothetical protein
MRVCKDDLDNFDPWRLPARQTENIALRFPRPDVSIALTANQLLTTDGYGQNSIFIEGIPPASGAQGDLNLDSTYQFFPSSTIPTLYTISPNTGTHAGGTNVIITGTNFVNITNVKLGGANVASYNIVSPTEMTAVTAAYPITGLVDLEVVSTFGVSVLHGSFTYT